MSASSALLRGVARPCRRCGQWRALATQASSAPAASQQPLLRAAEVRSAPLANNGGFAFVHKPAAVTPVLANAASASRPAYAELTEQQKELIKQLRQSDPEKHTVQVLARKFNVSGKTISVLAPAPPERKAALKEEAARLEGMKKHQRVKYARARAGTVERNMKELDSALGGSAAS